MTEEKKEIKNKMERKRHKTFDFYNSSLHIAER